MILLSRKLKVDAYEVSMVVGKRDNRREDILSFLGLMRERSNTITAGVTNLDFFMEKIEDHPFGPRFLWSMFHYGYIVPIKDHRSEDEIDFQKEVFTLTPFGQEVVNTGVVYLPQSGNFVAHITNDPLLEGMELLALTPIQEASVREQWKEDGRALSDKGAAAPRSVALPPALKALSAGGIVELPAQGKEKQLIKEIKDSAFASRMVLDVDLEIRLAPGEPSRMAIVREGKRTELELPYHLSYGTVMSATAKEANLEMDGEQESVLVSLDDVSDKELQTLRRQLPDLRLGFPGLGEFTARFTEELPLRPRALGDASRWASKLMLMEVDDYVTKDGYDTLLAEYAEKFARWYIVSDVVRNMPSFEEILNVAEEYARKGDQRHWFFHAPIDLDGGVVE